MELPTGPHWEENTHEVTCQATAPSYLGGHNICMTKCLTYHHITVFPTMHKCDHTRLESQIRRDHTIFYPAASHRTTLQIVRSQAFIQALVPTHHTGLNRLSAPKFSPKSPDILTVVSRYHQPDAIFLCRPISRHHQFTIYSNFIWIFFKGEKNI